jgi:hypothetical protein
MWGAGGTSVPGAGSQGAEQVGTRIAEWRGAGLAQVVMILFRVSQIESGDVSTQDVLSRFVAARGGTLKLIADFGDEQLKLA